MASAPTMLAIGSTLSGAAVFVLVRTIRNTLYSEDLTQGNEWRYDVNRINELRGHSLIYRFFYPLMRGLSAFNRRMFRDSMPAIGREVQAAGHSRFWTPEEYLARLQVITLLVAPGYFYFWLIRRICGWTIGGFAPNPQDFSRHGSDVQWLP